MNKIKEIIDWWTTFNNTDLLIKSKSQNFDITINNNMLPHLLGLQYATKNLRGYRLLNFIKNKSDEEIYTLINKENPDKLLNVKNRIENFKYFMENIEHSILYEQSHYKSKISSKWLLVKNSNNTYLHLGISKKLSYADYFETFIVDRKDKYFKNSKIKEKIVSIQKWDEHRFVPFSFKNVDQNRKDNLMIEQENKKFDREKIKKEKENQVKELEVRIKNLIKDFKYNKEDIVEYLKFSAKFRKYSYKNTMLIYSQNKSASHIASFNQISKMGYRINRGEKAIKIFAPSESKYAVINGIHRPLKTLSKEEKEKVKNNEYKVLTYRSFVPVNVFDISQSNIKADELPKILGLNNLIDVEVKDKIEIIEEYTKKNNTKIFYKNLPLDLKGEYNSISNEISINERLDDIGKLSTLTHELGHSLLHNNAVEYISKNENVIEVQADVTTLLLFEYFNIPVLDSRIEHLKYHFEKINEKEIEKQILPVINVTNSVINEIEKYIPGKMKEKIDKNIEETQKEEYIEKNIDNKEYDLNVIDFER